MRCFFGEMRRRCGCSVDEKVKGRKQELGRGWGQGRVSEREREREREKEGKERMRERITASTVQTLMTGMIASAAGGVDLI